MIRPILKSINLKAILFIVITQVFVKYFLFEPFTNGNGLYTTLSTFDFFLLVLATFCLGISGSIIYDLHKDNQLESSETDENKDIDDLKFKFFVAFTLIGIGLGYYLSYRINFTSLSSVFIIASALLYVYASFLKIYPIVGNLTISIILGLSIFSVALFDLVPVISKNTLNTQSTFIELTLDYCIIISILNFLKSSIADFLSIDFDYKVGNSSLPIALGRGRAKYIITGFIGISMILIILYLTIHLYVQPVLVTYFLLFLVAPLILCMIKIWSNHIQKSYHQAILLLNISLIATTLSLILHPIILLNHA